MDWLTQNWVWIVFAIGAVWLFSRGGLAGCGMGGHGSHGGNSSGADSAPGQTSTSGDAARNPGSFAGAAPKKAVDPVSGCQVRQRSVNEWARNTRPRSFIEEN